MKQICVIVFSLAVISGVLYSFIPSEEATESEENVQADFDLNAYWYSGKAELSSYELKQARYGEVHQGTSVLVFVTEPFNTKKFVKSDYGSENDVSVLKLNNTRNFNTGIYPYSLMTSSFLPFENGDHSLKVSSSSQEWCGHTYMTLENRKEFNVLIESYFEGESNMVSIDKALLEDDFWSKIRLNPDGLPTGKLEVIPSFFYLRMRHAEIKNYSCMATLEKSKETSTYTLSYPEINRSISIIFESGNAHKILSWEEEYKSGFGSNSKLLKTEGKLIKTIQTDYWNKHKTSDTYLRTELGLE